MELKPGDILNIEGDDCVIDENAVEAITVWEEVFETLGKDCDEEGATVGFYTVDGEPKCFPPSKVLEALKKSETITQNKSFQGA